MQAAIDILPPLVGKTVVLRKFWVADFSAIRSWVNNPLVTRDLMDAHIFEHEHTEAETWGFLNNSLVIDPSNIRLVVADKATNTYLGQIALFNFSHDGRVCELDLVIADPDKWDQGIGAETFELAAGFACRHCGVATVLAKAKNTNQRAAACLKKAGFQLDATSLTVGTNGFQIFLWH